VEKLVDVKTSQGEFITKKLENIELIAQSLKENRVDFKTGSVSSSGNGLSESDRHFLIELTNDTRDAIQDMRLEVLTASDKSK
jgi:hypothetical protein